MCATGTCLCHACTMLGRPVLFPCLRPSPLISLPGLMVDAELIKPQKQQQRAEEAAEEEANGPAPAAAKPPAKQPAAAKPQPKSAAPVIKRLVSAPTATLPRAASASSSALGGEDASRSSAASRAASATIDGRGSTASAAAPLNRPGSSSSSTGAEPQGLTTAAAAARKQLEQQRKAAAALKLDIATAAGRRSSAAAPAGSNSSRSGTAVGAWGKVPRSTSVPAAKAAGEEWPALGPVRGLGAPAVSDHVLVAATMARVCLWHSGPRGLTCSCSMQLPAAEAPVSTCCIRRAARSSLQCSSLVSHSPRRADMPACLTSCRQLKQQQARQHRHWRQSGQRRSQPPRALCSQQQACRQAIGGQARCPETAGR